MAGWTILAFTAACGLTAAAIAACLYNVVAGSRHGFQLFGYGPGWILLSGMYFMVAGPYLVLSGACEHWRSGKLAGSAVGMAFVIAALWSFFAGVFVVNGLVLAGIIVS